MDVLFHFALSFAGFYILFKGLKVDFRLWEVFGLSMLAGLIDIDHVIFVLPETAVLHNLTFVLGLPMLLFFIFRYAKMGEKGKKFQIFALAFSIILIGHLLTDMVTGLSGIPLFSPFYTDLFLIPQNWKFIEIDHSYVVTPTGIAVSIYFDLIFTILILFRIKNK